MKLIRQVVLVLKEGKSEKIYYVDLCEVSKNKYVVNFRFGTRGTKLREGTKTIFPVYRSVAEKVFSDLVNSKLKAGYKSHSDQESTETPLKVEGGKKPSQANIARKEAILDHLKQAVQEQKRKGKWKLSRVIWRAGEMKLPQAVPYLIELAGQGDDMQQYCIAWSLGRCGDQETVAEVVRILLHDYYSESNSEALRRIAAEGICRLQKDAPQQDEFFQALIDTLPAGLQEPVQKSDDKGLLQKLKEYVFELKTTSNDYLTTLYHLSWKYPHIRKPLLEILADLPLKPNYFNQIRYIFKAAEFREDKDVYGLLAYRFEKTPERYQRRWSDRYQYSYDAGRWQRRKKEKKNVTPNSAYSNRTRHYFRNRIMRTLKRAGELENSSYPEMAAGILLRFSDAVDKTEPYHVTTYRYQYRPWRRIEHTVHYDSYAKYNIFNFLLYANSPRYELKNDANAWNCVSPYQPGQPAPDVREEAFPELWTDAPHSLLTLLLNSHCQRVHEFAVKAFKAVPDYGTLVSIEQVISMLGLPYQVTNALALEIAQQKYSPRNPDKALVLALINCQYQAAREIARRWIEEKLAFFMEDSGFACNLIFNSQDGIRQWTRSLLPTCHFSDSQEKAIITRAISTLLALKAEEIEEEFVRDVGEILLLTFPRKMYKLGIEVIRDLLAHPHLQIQALAGKILLKHAIDTRDLPEDLFLALLQATSPHVRAIGVQLLGKLPDYILLNKERVLINFCISELPEIRKAAKPVIGRLARTRKEFGDNLVKQLYTVFLFKEACKDLHQDLYNLFTEELTGNLGLLDHAKTWKLLTSKYQQANLLGCYLLKTTCDIRSFSTQQIVKLAKSELYELRESVRNFYRANPERIKKEKEDALGIVDSDWDDTRSFAFTYFRTTFSEDDWTPDLLVNLCDSVRQDVQTFGREMITRFFDEADGPEYLLKLSQHPSADLQLFATNYLEGFAAGNIEGIQKLEPYFVTVLSQVNKARVAKSRILQFLRTEAMKNDAAAQVAARILTRQSLTLAIGDKAECIEILRDIRKKYPNIETPITIKDVAVYAKRV